MKRARHQDGSLQIVGTGKNRQYFTRFRVYDENGKPSQPKVYLGLVKDMTKSEALKKRAEIMAERLHQAPRTAPSLKTGMTLETFYKERFLILRTHWSEAHRDSFAYIMESHVLPPLGHHPVAVIDKIMVQGVLNRMEAKYSWSTIDHVRRKLYEVMEEALEQEFITKNSVKKTNIPANARKPEKPVIKADWLSALISKVTDGRDKAILMVATFCALRTSEVFGMPWGNFFHDEETGEAFFMIDQIAYRGKRLKRTKNDASRARVHISPMTLAAVLQWKKECKDTSPDALIFPSTNKNGRGKKGSPMYPSTWLQKHLQPIAKAMGIPFHVNFRATRRTAATLAQENGSSPASAQGMLRHASLQTTMEIYTQVVPENVKIAVNDYESMVLSKKTTKPKLAIVRKK